MKKIRRFFVGENQYPFWNPRSGIQGGMVVGFIIAIILLFIKTAIGANYYVDCSAGSDGSGTYASPWNVYTSHIANDLSNSDGVYFKGGVTCTLNGSTRDKITITNSSVTIGCYDGDGDTTCETIDITTGANMPKFDGGDTYPGGDYEHFLRIHAANVTVQDLWITNMVQGDGIQANGDTQAGNSATIQRCRVDDIWRQGISGRDCDNCTFTENYISNVLLVNDDSCTEVGSAGLTCDYGCDNTVISYNTVKQVYGECIGGYFSYNTGNPIIIEYNTVYNCRSASIHSSESEYVVRYNIVGVFDEGGDGYEPHFYSGTYPNCTLETKSGAIAVNSTDNNSTAFDSKFHIYGNFVFGYKQDPGIACDMTEAARTQGDTIECLIYNNTLVDNGPNIQTHHLGTDDGVQSYIYNNISVFYDQSAYHGHDIDANGRTTYDYNLWDSDPSDDDVEGAHDPSYADAALSTQAGYVWPATITTITEDDFKINSGSPAIDVGETLGSPYNSDFWETVRPQGSAYDIGAFEYGTQEEQSDISGLELN
jgi:hypothetical protein